MNESCCGLIYDQITKAFEDPSLASKYRSDLDVDFDLSQKNYARNPCKFNSESMALIVWKKKRFEQLHSLHSCNRAKTIVNEEVLLGKYRENFDYKKSVWDTTTNGAYVACPYFNKVATGEDVENQNKKYD